MFVVRSRMASLRADASSADVLRPKVVARAVVIACTVAATVLTSKADHWEPVAFVIALGAALVAADVASVATRRIRISAGLLVQTTIMAILGPGPAVLAAAFSTLVESRINRVGRLATLNNLMIFSLLGLIGGLMFEVLRTSLGLEREDPAYALLVVPVYIVLAFLNLLLLVGVHPDIARGARWRVIVGTALPAVPLELVNAMLAGVAVYVWAQAGLGAAVAVVVVLAVTIPLARTIADALKRGDDLLELRQVSDERAAEVSRLSLDRDRLLTEVLQAEQRERGRLAASLHDGPMQRLMAMRQDASGSDPEYTQHLDRAIAETRSIISAFHPATVRELGFEASLRAAVAPFPAAKSVQLTVRTEVDDRALAGSLLMPVAQELVVNAIKHADPTAVDVVVTAVDDDVIVEINDDGVGIDSQRADEAVQAGHVGLAMVRRRVQDAGGRLEIATRPDGGTRSRVVMPAATAFE